MCDLIEDGIRLYRFRALESSWAPWTHQIVNEMKDGRSYGQPGYHIITGWANFRDEASARAAFAKIQGTRIFKSPGTFTSPGDTA